MSVVVCVGVIDVVRATPARATGPTVFTWTGADTVLPGTPNTDWSDPNNWAGGVAPSTSDGPVDLNFSTICPADCTLFLNQDSTDDIPGLVVENATFAAPGNSDGYRIIGSTPLTVDGSISGRYIAVQVPVVLGGSASQTWSFTGPVQFVGITGTAPLTITLANMASVWLTGSTEVGSLSIIGEDPADTGATASLNGTVTAAYPGDFNETDQSPISLTDAKLLLAQPTGPVSTNGGQLVVGGYPTTSGGAEVNGSVTLGPATDLQFNSITFAAGGYPADTPTLSTTGSLNLASARLDLLAGCQQPAGTSYVLVTADGGLVGDLTDQNGEPITNGEIVPTTATEFTACPGTSVGYGAGPPLVRINISGTTITATVVGLATTTAVAVVGTATVTSDLNVVATVQPVAPVTGYPSGVVEFLIDGSPVDGCQAVALGNTPTEPPVAQATCDAGSFTGGFFTLTAVYEGDQFFSGSQDTIQGEVSPPAPSQGYWIVGTDGSVYTGGDAPYWGDMGGLPLNSPIVGMAATWDDGGYWEVASDGGIFAFGDAQFYGSMGAKALNKPIVGIAATPDGGGYWEVASDGGIFAFGDAQFYGSMGAKALNEPIVSIASTFDGAGYWEVASDGGIFAFGDAQFYGSAAGADLPGPIVQIVST